MREVLSLSLKNIIRKTPGNYRKMITKIHFMIRGKGTPVRTLKNFIQNNKFMSGNGIMISDYL